MARTAGITIVTPKFRVSFPKVFKPEFNKLAKRDEYSVVALFELDQDISAIKDAAMKAAKEAWGDNPKKWPKKWKNPLKDQGEREKEDDKGVMQLPDGYTKGATMITMKSKNKPGVVDQQKKEIVDESEFYAGCYARANVYINVFNVEDGLNQGISISLNHLQKVADGEPFSGRRKAEDSFEAIEMPDAVEEAAEPTDENPFG